MAKKKVGAAAGFAVILFGAYVTSKNAEENEQSEAREVVASIEQDADESSDLASGADGVR